MTLRLGRTNPYHKGDEGSPLSALERETKRERSLVFKDLVVERRHVKCRPTSVGLNETIKLMNVRKGDVVLAVHCYKRKLGDGTTPKISIGDGGSVARFVPATLCNTGSEDDILQPTASNLPYVYTADDTIDGDYIAGLTYGTAFPLWQVVIITLPMQAYTGREGTYR